MSKEDSPAPGGLLSKVVRFVRNPLVDWADLDAIDSERVNPYDKQMLKAAIERKRCNDFVRQREFEQLRKLRQRGAHPARQGEEAVARVSSFHNSSAPEERSADTLKKIDEIEAQMSQQWWKNHPVAQTPLPRATGAQFAATEPAGLDALLASAPAAGPPFAKENLSPSWFASLAPSQPGKPGLVSSSSAKSPAAPAIAAAPAPPTRQPFAHDPEMEEAAILFANGDHPGAESALRELLAQRRDDAPEQQLETWLTLFDLYRATGRHEGFEALAIDYAARFGRSAPLWFSMPGQIGLAAAPPPTAASAPPAPLLRRDFSWNAPPTLGLPSLAALQASIARSVPPWSLSWARLAAIDEAALPKLTELMGQWAGVDGQFTFAGVEKLNALLEAMTPSGDRARSTAWWQLRMAALRLMGKADEFELVALDYCVTYEVSPPSWTPPRCAYADNEGASSATEAAGGPVSDFTASDLGEPSALQAPDSVPAARLCGHIEGSATPLLEPLAALARRGAALPIDCERLIRVDFVAAGSVLNWAAGQQGQGQVVEFHGLQRLVAIFFNVIGINEHAWVLPRRD